jgi:hypothetical protein
LQNRPEDQNVVVEYHWLKGDHGRLPALMADLADSFRAQRRSVRF